MDLNGAFPFEHPKDHAALDSTRANDLRRCKLEVIRKTDHDRSFFGNVIGKHKV